MRRWRRRSSWPRWDQGTVCYEAHSGMYVRRLACLGEVTHPFPHRCQLHVDFMCYVQGTIFLHP